ncbi:MAG: rRNA maturation RNase YbeY [Saprospiraceae bacterium]|nr:rRNA maturation RNase YbeY [Saprospiraceae bacterium]
MIRFHYKYPAFRVRSAQKIKSWLQAAARKEKRSIKYLDYIFVTDEEILQLNRQSLDHDYYTDILTFPASYQPIIGEIYISIDRIKEQAVQYKIAPGQELRRIMVHGLLHLCEYDDRTVHLKQKMTKREDLHLANFL